jgi:hypothetical protein|tara:strand:- start:1494 stop:1841 length:348 start_codon:yes stop_codon:yes gene_type:complete
MKKRVFMAIVFTGIISSGAIAQETVKTPVKKEVTKKIDQDVKMEVKNGVKTLTIKSNAGGYPVEEIYTGEAAEKKRAELETKKAKEIKPLESLEKKQKIKKIIKIEKRSIEKSAN